MNRLEWKRNPALDTTRAVTELGTYLCVRTWADVSVLTLDGVELRRGSDGGHAVNQEVAQEHYDKHRLRKNG